MFLEALHVHHLRYTVQADELVRLGPQAGAQLRGALWSALNQFACTDPDHRGNPRHQRHCPMCRLFHLETQKGQRGLNPARPFTIRPPLAPVPEDDRIYRPGTHFTFGISLLGDASALFPYIVQAVYRMGQIGVGYGRGTFSVSHIQAYNPLTRQQQSLFEDGRVVDTPSIPATCEQVNEASAGLAASLLTLRFVTPAQITTGDNTDTSQSGCPPFDAIVARLVERCQSIELHYTDQPTPQPRWRDAYLQLTEQAAAVTIVRDETWWVNAHSGSRRANRRNSISGVVGEVTFSGDLKPFIPWLVWGQSLHVGKNTAKGNGWYEIVL